MDLTAASIRSRSQPPLCGAQPALQQPWQVAPELRPHSDLPHPLSLFPAPWPWHPGDRRPSAPSPEQAAAPIPCLSPACPGWAACRLQAAPGSKSPALCPGRRPGRSLSAPIVWPLVWAGEQGLSSVTVSRNRFASALGDQWPVLLHLSAALGLADAELL